MAEEAFVAEIASAAAQSIPRANLWRRLVSARVPSVSEGRAGRCRRCGRSLPVFSGPNAFGPMGRLPVVSFDRSEMESALLCLVCGPRGRHAATLSVEDVLTAATTVCARLRAAHWRRWHRRLRDALDASAGPSQVEEVGQVLEMFRKFGPGRLARSRAHAGDPFEILVAGSARLWPTR